MDAIQAARELGKAIQQDERHIRIMSAQAKNDADEALQDAIGAFNLKRTQLNAEIQKTDKDQDKIKLLDAELKTMYSKIFENGNMIEFAAAKAEMEALLAQVNQIITGSASGLDPDAIDIDAESCGGSCASCAGCH